MIKDDKIVSIPSGLFGFEELTEYSLAEAEQKPFLILKSPQSKDISFILVDPLYFCQDYEINLSDEDMSDLGVTDQDFSQVYALAIVTVRPQEDPQMTANLQGPIVINGANLRGKQCISTNPRWNTQHDILSELQKQQRVTQC